MSAPDSSRLPSAEPARFPGAVPAPLLPLRHRDDPPRAIRLRPLLLRSAVACLALLLCGLGGGVGAAEEETPDTLQVAPDRSTDGVYQLSWARRGRVVLEESADPTFASPRVVYRGPDNATTITGRRNGRWYYRLRLEDGTLTPPVSVQVEHHALGRALFFFSIGFVVFAATVGLVVRGGAEALDG